MAEMTEMDVFCIQYRLNYRAPVAFFYALSAQDAVNQFRANRFETIVAVYRLEKVGDWQ